MPAVCLLSLALFFLPLLFCSFFLAFAFSSPSFFLSFTREERRTVKGVKRYKRIGRKGKTEKM